MSTVNDVLNIYEELLIPTCDINIAEMIVAYIRIVAIDECVWCCDENCEKLELDEENWKPFKLLCGGDYGHDGTLTEDYFQDVYAGNWSDLSDFAQDTCENCDDGSIKGLPWYIKNNIDWGKVWKTISHDYNVYEDGFDNYVFSYF
jgi:hypothetical protein